MTIEELLTQKKDLVQAAEEIRSRVYDEHKGEWAGDDEAKFDELMANAERVSQTIERMAKLEAAQRSLEAAEQPKERRTKPILSERHPVPSRPRSDDRMLALQGWMARGHSEAGRIIGPEHHEAASRCGIDLNQRSIQIRLANQAPRSLDTREYREWEERVVTIAVESPDEGGNLTVPDEMMRPLERSLLAFGGMRQSGAQVIRTASGADLPIPMNNDTGNTGALLAEATEHTELDPSFTSLTLNSFKYTSRRIGVSVEYLQDNAVNAVQTIGEMLGERIGRITNAHFTTGTGSGQPNGAATAATSALTAASATVVTHDELIDLKHAVDPAYRDRGARWMFNDATLVMLKKIKIPQFSGDTAGQPLWRPGMALSEPNTIDGDPYTINQQVAGPTTGNRAILYGDFSKYVIRDVRDITLVRLDERYAELGVVAFLAFSRHDGDLLDAGTNPVQCITMG